VQCPHPQPLQGNITCSPRQGMQQGVALLAVARWVRRLQHQSTQLSIPGACWRTPARLPAASAGSPHTYTPPCLDTEALPESIKGAGSRSSVQRVYRSGRRQPSVRAAVAGLTAW
jgi:hypothetical protein